MLRGWSSSPRVSFAPTLVCLTVSRVSWAKRGGGGMNPRTDTRCSFDEAQQFLNALAAGGRFTFQTFDDDQDRKDEKLAHVMHGSLGQHFDELCALNGRGAGIFTTVNETDGK